MKHLQFAISLDDDAVKALGEIVHQIIGSMPKEMTRQERSQHAIFGGQTPPEDRGLLITSREAAKLLQISERTLWRMKDMGQTPKPIRIGRGVRWSVEELSAWVRAGCPPRDKWSFDWKEFNESR